MNMLRRMNTPARREVFADFFDEFFNPDLLPSAAKLYPAVDISEEKDNSKKYHYYERSYGSFERRFVLPRETDAENIDAKYENGELVVSVPKTEAKKPKEIKVK